MIQGKVHPSPQAVVVFGSLVLTSAFHRDFITSLVFCPPRLLNKNVQDSSGHMDKLLYNCAS